MSNNNNNFALTIDGRPNLNNPIVLAAFLDMIGINYTRVVNDIASNPDSMELVGIENAGTLVKIHAALKLMRDAVGVTEYPDDIVFRVTLELEEYNTRLNNNIHAQEDRIRELGRAMGMEREVEAMIQRLRASHGIPNRPSAASVADSILRDLSDSGVLDRPA
jgi:hypothetical protein